MVWLPTARSAVEYAALFPLSVTAFSVAVPSLNVTVPVGLAPPVTVTVAVNVTVSPAVAGFADDLRAVVVGSILRKPAVAVSGADIVTTVDANLAFATFPDQ